MGRVLPCKRQPMWSIPWWTGFRIAWTQGILCLHWHRYMTGLHASCKSCKLACCSPLAAAAACTQITQVRFMFSGLDRVKLLFVGFSNHLDLLWKIYITLQIYKESRTRIAATQMFQACKCNKSIQICIAFAFIYIYNIYIYSSIYTLFLDIYRRRLNLTLHPKASKLKHSFLRELTTVFNSFLETSLQQLLDEIVFDWFWSALD